MFLSRKRLYRIIDKAVEEAKREGYKKGYSDGLHRGITSDKEGLHINGNGMYMFKDEVAKIVIQQNEELRGVL